MSRSWFAFGLGAAVQGALVGACIHSLPLVLFNFLWIGINLYSLSTREDK